MRAFTLLETLVAVTILIVSISGPLTTAQQSLQSAIFSRDQITASYLAQEGIEYMRARRDENFMLNQSWTTGLSSGAQDCINKYCNVDFSVTNLTHTNADCSSGTAECTKLYISPNGLYGITALGNTQTRFQRSVKLVPVPPLPTPYAVDEYIVFVKMTWQSGRYLRTMELEDRIFRWL